MREGSLCLCKAGWANGPLNTIDLAKSTRRTANQEGYFRESTPALHHTIHTTVATEMITIVIPKR
eukprot:6462910-Amphidinium_carterae.1